MAFSRTTIDGLFATSKDVRNTIWTGFSTTDRELAIPQAQRLLSLYNGGALTETATTDADLIRPDWACALQALHVLTHSKQLPDGTQVAPKFITNDGEGERSTEPQPGEDLFSFEALCFLTGTLNPAMPGDEEDVFTDAVTAPRGS